MELWVKHPSLFWKKYWEDKKAGTIKYFRNPNANPKFKSKAKKEKLNFKKLNKRPSDSEEDDQGGLSPKASKAEKKRR